MFNKETEYAFRALVYIQVQNYLGYRPGTDEIAKEIDAPRFFIAKILQNLARKGILQSVKGKGGGFFFKPDAPEVTLKSLVVTIEGEKVITSCVFGLKHCNCNNPCPLHHIYASIRDSVNDMVATETIQSLAKKELQQLEDVRQTP